MISISNGGRVTNDKQTKAYFSKGDSHVVHGKVKRADQEVRDQNAPRSHCEWFRFFSISVSSAAHHAKYKQALPPKFSTVDTFQAHHNENVQKLGPNHGWIEFTATFNEHDADDICFSPL